jgi:hypothetical protein
MGGACSAYGEGGAVCRVLVGKPEGKRPLGRHRYRWIFRKWDVGVMDWIEVVVDRGRWRELLNAAMNLRVQ